MESSPVETEGDHQWMWIEKAAAAKAAQPELKYLTAGNNYKRLQTIPLNDNFLISPAIRAKELFYHPGMKALHLFS